MKNAITPNNTIIQLHEPVQKWPELVDTDNFQSSVFKHEGGARVDSIRGMTLSKKAVFDFLT